MVAHFNETKQQILMVLFNLVHYGSLGSLEYDKNQKYLS